MESFWQWSALPRAIAINFNIHKKQKSGDYKNTATEYEDSVGVHVNEQPLVGVSRSQTRTNRSECASQKMILCNPTFVPSSVLHTTKNKTGEFFSIQLPRAILFRRTPGSIMRRSGTLGQEGVTAHFYYASWLRDGHLRWRLQDAQLLRLRITIDTRFPILTIIS